MIKTLYKKLSARKISELYHTWVEKNGFIEFTTWEIKVLNEEIIIVI